MLYYTTISLPLVGVSFGKRQSLLATLSEGEPLFFKQEKGNAYDPQALALVTSTGEHVGYIGRNNTMRNKLNNFIDERAGMLIARLAHMRGGYDGKNIGADVEFYAIPSDYFDLRMENKDDGDFTPFKSINSGFQRKKDYYAEKMAHKKEDREAGGKNRKHIKSHREWKKIYTRSLRRELNAMDVGGKSANAAVYCEIFWSTVHRERV